MIAHLCLLGAPGSLETAGPGYLLIDAIILLILGLESLAGPGYQKCIICFVDRSCLIFF